MKNILKITSLVCLILFSFFYTDKVINIINKKDKLMIELDNIKYSYEVLPVNAIIDGDTIIPGIKGKEVDLEKSYNNMKLNGIFREDALIYNSIMPNELLYDNIDKYIIKGNNLKSRVSLIVIAGNIDRIKEIEDINIFLNHKDINIDNIKKIKGNVYSYGNNGIYTKEVLTNDNIIINRISNNKSNYCLFENKNNNMLKVCNEEKMYGIVPNITGGYLEVKNKLSNGSIILLDDISNIDVIMKYIRAKGYEIVSLDELLQE